MSVISERPATSKARGVCKFYTTPRGCFAGKTCKFLHGEADKITPYDQAKTCKFFAAGYCKRGADCWFAHVAPPSADAPACGSRVAAIADEDEHMCCICLDKPVTYGLLSGCSHIYCIQCIRDWRDRKDKSHEMIVSGNTKKCPLCRALSPFVTPSSHYYPDGDPGKETMIERYKASMARVPCRHFQRSQRSDRFCPFGRDCFYQHLNADGTPYIFEQGVNYYIKQRTRLRYSWETEDSNDEEHSPWLQELSTALEAIRAYVPTYAQRHQEDPESESDDWLAEPAPEAVVGSPAYVRAQEALSQLAYPTPPILSRMASSEPSSPTHSFTFFRDSGTPLRFSPLLSLTEALPMIPPATHTNGSRFSTVVRSRMPDYVFGSISEAEVSLWTTDEAVQTEQPNTPDYPAPVSTTAPSDLELLILLHPPSPSVLDPSAALEPFTETSTAVPPAPTLDDVWHTPTTLANECDPPLLTDGRGRVVWSTTAASRRGRGRAGSSTCSIIQQRKARLREDSVASEGRDPVATEEIRSPHMTRARSFPESSGAGGGGVVTSSPSLLLDDLV